jgi:hypothetical protein
MKAKNAVLLGHPFGSRRPQGKSAQGTVWLRSEPFFETQERQRSTSDMEAKEDINSESKKYRV